MKPYKLKKIRKPVPDMRAVNRPVKEVEMENLTGFVRGKKASDIEERFGRALDKNPRVSNYLFQVSYIAGMNLPGEIRLDFLVFSGGTSWPIQIDGEFAHKTAAQKAEDAIKDAILDDHLKGQAQPVQRIDGELLDTQENADKLVRRLF